MSSFHQKVTCSRHGIGETFFILAFTNIHSLYF